MSPIPIRNSQSAFRNGFTLTELLIVIAIIVLFITLALPAFNLITGSRSIAGASNEVAAMLGRARAEAVGTQQPRGVGFYVDAASGRCTMCIVHQPFEETPSSVVTSASAATPAGTYVMPAASTYDVWDGTTLHATDQYVVDIENDTDTLSLPAGVGAMLLNNCTFSAGARTNCGYVSFGAIMFDGTGEYVPRAISIAQYGTIGTKANLNNSSATNLPPTTTGGITSQFGVVLFDLQTFKDQGYSVAPQSVLTGNTYSSVELNQDNWLDKNATPQLVNRYNGTLLQSQ